MDCKKRNKIKMIVRLQQILKKWRKATNIEQKPSNSSTSKLGKKGFIKRSASSYTTLASGRDAVVDDDDDVPKGFVAVCVGEELKRFVIPTGFLGHKAFGILLRGAEEEFGFQQEGVLRIPCEVSVFEKILKVVTENRKVFF